MPSHALDGLLARLRSWFPEREFFMRSQGHVRFIRVTTKLQMRIAGGIAAALLVWLATMAVMIVVQFTNTRSQSALLQREAAVASAESRVTRYRNGVGEVAQDLQKRQDFIEKVVESHLGDLPADLPNGTVSDSTAEAGKTVRKISMELPEAAGLARIEARQLAFIEKLTRFADARATQAETAIRRVGLNPALVAASVDDRSAQGGPLIRMLTGPGDEVDPRFARLGASFARMATLEQGLARIPNTLPASLEYISSGFGAPIYAAAAGSVSFAGIRSGYGNCVEVDHGNGLMTRYAHMSRIGAHIGQKVGPGDVLGAIGSTGRSTGPHLHFEVRINDRPVNPRPFLEASQHVLEEARSGRPVGNNG